MQPRDASPSIRLRAADRLLMTICWIAIGLAAALFALAAAARISTPSLGMEWRRDSGLIFSVDSDGAAAAGGLRVGDQIVSNGDVAPHATRALYDASAGKEMVVVYRRGTQIRSAVLVPGLQSGDGLAFAGVATGALRLIVNLFVLTLAISLLAFRPHIRAALLAAMALAAWLGGNHLLGVPGLGAFLSLPAPLEMAIHLLDSLFTALFFAFAIHFALLFPEPLPFVQRRPRLQWMPYLATAPLAIVSMLEDVRFLASLEPSQLVPPAFLLVYEPLLLLSVACFLSLHFRYSSGVNDVRRLKLLVVSVFPGLLGWVFSLFVEEFSGSAPVRQWASLTMWLGIGASFGIFSWAVVRHRLFGMRPIARRSVQYAFARGTLYFAVTLPLLALAAFLYVHRDESLADLVHRDSAILAGLVLAAAILIRFRQVLLDAIDRRFFREDYDARQGLLRVVSMIQRGTDIMVLGRVALLEIEKALHPIHVSLWLLDSSEQFFQQVISLGEDREAPRLSRTDPLLRLIATSYDLDRSSAGIRRLTQESQNWLHVTGAALAVPLSVERELTGYLILGDRLSEEPYGADDRSLLRSIAGQLALTEDYGRLEILARKDPLTEALNRHAFYSLLEKRRIFPFPGTSGCVAVVDVNDLKAINDSFGHAAGDLAIRRVASAIRSVVRADDLVFRWGGDEFLIILYGISIEDVRRRLGTIDERIAQASSSSEFRFPVTVSVGVTSFEEMTFIPAAIEEADREMYARKQSRRADRPG
ncbi:MAG TPA: diguanylate cyclase [Thermoanaerobaculia bacterium]|nr:diguanylate cyclase [Thermoanaerobaculia bacterium]